LVRRFCRPVSLGGWLSNQSLYPVRSKIVRFGWTTHNITWANIYMVIDLPMHGSIAWVNPDAINKIASRWQLAQHPMNHVSLRFVCSTHQGLAPLGHEEWGPPYFMLKCFAFFAPSFLLSWGHYVDLEHRFADKQSFWDTISPFNMVATTVLPKLGVVNCGTKKLKTVLG